MIPQFLDKPKIPHKPGVYIFRNKKTKVLYIGKAIDLRSRVASYFFTPKKEGVKIVILSKEIASIDTITTESELEALILEANLIKKYLPLFNVRLTDDKDYLYIAITRESFPKIVTARKKDLPAGRQASILKKYWGPYPSARTVKDTLKKLRRVFPWCSGGNIKNRRACFYYHLGLCGGACVGLVSKKDYNRTINAFSKFLDGKKEELVEGLTLDMEKASVELRFEMAEGFKKTLSGINYLTQPNRSQLYLENPNFLQDETKGALAQLQKDLNLKKIPQRIECFDISNTQGKDTTGSLVVLTGGEIDKSQYRKFKIHLSSGPNDVGMMKEMIKRRLTHTEWPKPGLILVDGGRGQARAVKFEVRSAKLEVPVFGLAKRMEWLYPPEGEVIKLAKASLSLKLLQKIRDEAHRFALKYHRQLRDKIN